MEQLIEFEFASLIGAVLSLLGHLILITASTVLIYKKRNIGSTLMLFGSVLSMLFYIGSIAWTQFASRESAEAIAQTVLIQNAVGPLPYLIFGLGLFAFAIKLVKIT